MKDIHGGVMWIRKTQNRLFSTQALWSRLSDSKKKTKAYTNPFKNSKIYPRAAEVLEIIVAAIVKTATIKIKGLTPVTKNIFLVRALIMLENMILHLEAILRVKGIIFIRPISHLCVLTRMDLVKLLRIMIWLSATIIIP